MNEAFSIGGVLSFSWKRFLEAPWRVLWVMAVMIGVSALSSYVLGELTRNGEFMIIALGGVLDFVIQTFIGISFVMLALKVHDDILSLQTSDVWAPEHFWRYLGATIITAIIVLVGFVFLIIPGIIAMTMLIFAPYLVVDKKIGPIAAIKESAAMTKGHRWRLFGLLIVATILNLIGALLFLVGLLLTIPVTMLAIARAYRVLSGVNGVESVTPESA